MQELRTVNCNFLEGRNSTVAPVLSIWIFQTRNYNRSAAISSPDMVHILKIFFLKLPAETMWKSFYLPINRNEMSKPPIWKHKLPMVDDFFPPRRVIVSYLCLSVCHKCMVDGPTCFFQLHSKGVLLLSRLQLRCTIMRPLDGHTLSSSYLSSFY